MRVLPFFSAALAVACCALGKYSITLPPGAITSGLPLPKPEPAAQGYNPRPLAAPMYHRAPGRGHSSGRLGARHKRRLRNQAARAA